MMKLSIPLMIVFLGTGLSACTKKEEEKTELRECAIVRTNLPDSLKLGNQLNLKMVYAIANGCGKYHHPETQEEDRSITTRVYAEYPTGNVVCNMQIKYDSLYVTIFPKLKGIYEVKTGEGTGGLTTDTLVIY
jgi:hypothetical protein